MSDTETKPLTMSVEDAAALIPCSIDMYKRRLASRTWPGTKVGHIWRVTPAQVQQALDQMATKARDPDPPRPSGLSPRSRTIKRKSA